ncbi:hypothetical protein QCA50_004145 [Cerrena zonata]|uniref:Glyoxal oxidase n=1 Tax=Cerrena zonata TaxID=2478898 RepID=A0AAW0GRA7_9APHY
MSPSSCSTRASLLVLSLVVSTLGQSIAPTPGQPSRNDAPLGQFEIVGDSVASAQQIFLGTPDRVYVVDKTENNPTQIKGHPAWAAEYDVNGNTARPMDAVTNTFCAGGNVLGNGTWVNVGGNQAVTFGGLQAASQNGGGPYDDPDGGQSIRLLNPCEDSKCDWTLVEPMTTRRWYPTVEQLEDGTLFIIGGCDFGGFVNSADQNNPTYEFFPPPKNDPGPIESPLLDRTLPANLYPLTWLLPSGKLFMQANRGTAMLDYKKSKEYQLPDMIHAVRTYPASAGTTMMPLTPANNWTATILFCGGSDLQDSQWKPNWNIPEHPASTSCVSITPDVSTDYVEEEDLPEARSMGNLIMLPNGKILMLNGAGTGVAGYGNESIAVGQSYADNPVLTPIIYDPSAPMGQRWTRDGLSPSTVPRMYHSTATLLPDGSVFVAGSNPNADYTTDVKFTTEYRVERFYPSYYNQRRPQPQGLLTQYSYGGPYFNVTLTKDDLSGNSDNVKNTQVIIIRTGFSTHAMNMGQRFLQLENTYTINNDGSASLHVSQLPPNPAIFQPGPALIFVVVNGIPSVGVQVMLGSGQLGTQKTLAIAPLPDSGVAPSANNSNTSSGNRDQETNAAMRTLSIGGFDSVYPLVLLLLVPIWTLFSGL